MTLRLTIALLAALAACGKRPPAGDPALQNALSFKALDESDAITACLRKDGVQANLVAVVSAKSGRLLETSVTSQSGATNKATECVQEVIAHWALDPRLNGQASLILADDSADQDARTAKVEVGKVVESHDSAIFACHTVAVDRAEGDPPEGLVLIAWSIEKRKAIDLKVMSNDTGDSQLARCLMEEIADWSFPADAVGEVDWPFEFTASAQ